jgi:hypothetical protein
MNTYDSQLADEVFRERLLGRAKATNAKLVARFRTIADDLNDGRHRAALGGIFGAEAELEDLLCVLRLLGSEAVPREPHNQKGKPS